MFATIQDLYMRFGRENVLSAANLDGLDTTDPVNLPAIEERLVYFLGQAYDQLISALRQGSYNPSDFYAPYPQTLVNANCEIAFIQLYRTRHTEDETVPDAYKTIEENNFRLIRDIQGGSVRFDTNIPRAMSMPAVTRSSLPGFAATSQKVRPPARVNGILPDNNGNIVIDEPIKSTVFDSYVNAPHLAVAGKTYIDVDTGRWGFCYIGTNGVNRFLSITGGGGSGGTGDYRDLSYKPMINGVVVNGEQTGADLGLASLFTDEVDGTLLDLSDVYAKIVNLVISLQDLIYNGDQGTLDTVNQTLTTAYRTSQAQDTVDNTKVAKLDFTDPTTNPNGFVLLWMQPNFAADAVSIDYAGMQPVTGVFAPGTVALPFANVNAAGIMAKEDKQTLDNLTERMTAVEQGLSTERFVNTKADLLAVDTTNMPVWTPYIVRNDSDYDNATTKYYYNPEGESPTTNGFVFGFVAQEVPYTVATATTLGLTLSSTATGKVQYEGTGVGSVNGWDALVARVAALETWKTQQQNFNTTHNHSGGAQGVVLPKDFTVYTDDAAAQADTSGNQALSPIQ